MVSKITKSILFIYPALMSMDLRQSLEKSQFEGRLRKDTKSISFKEGIVGMVGI